MMDCKKALVEADGDYDKAIELLRKKGQKVSASRSDRETTEGVILVKTNDAQTEGIMIAFTCETDFVAKNADFLALGNEILEAAHSNNAADIEAIKALPSGDITIGERIIENIGKIGEKLEISAFERLTADQVVPYIHAGSKLGVLVGLSNTNGVDQIEAGKDVAMQIAAMNPIAVDKDGVDASIVEKEIEIGKEQARLEGKPEQMLEKIAMGKLNKFYKESTLLAQSFVKDNSVNISQYLDSVSKGMTVVNFKRVSIG
jgi:elongation factor Ts